MHDPLFPIPSDCTHTQDVLKAQHPQSLPQTSTQGPPSQHGPQGPLPAQPPECPVYSLRVPVRIRDGTTVAPNGPTAPHR
ncbi:unnamed protein product [Arctogadus glacialis]